MTFAIVRDGVIADHVAVGSLAELYAWRRGRRGQLVILDLAPGETASVGAPVDIETLLTDIATLARREAR